MGGASFIETNVRIGFWNIDGIRLYFFPDQLFVFGTGGVSSIQYTDLKLEANEVQFREEGSVPQDAKVIGKTWRYVNKGGGPDRRFANNYQIPIVLYGTLDVRSTSGIKLSLQTSTEGLAASSVELLTFIQAGVRELESRPAPEPETFPPFIDDPPPLASIAAQGIAGLGKLLSFRWVERCRIGLKPSSGASSSLSAGFLHHLVRGRRRRGDSVLVCGLCDRWGRNRHPSAHACSPRTRRQSN